MLIKIRYEATWRNSFLDGSNNEPIPRGGRKFIASMTELKRKGNYKSRQISRDTVMGVLNRLIGDQQKLYQARNSNDYYFSEIESILTEDCIRDIPNNTQELVYIRNITGSTDQNSWTGEIIENHVVFNSDFSTEFWSTLWLTKNELLSFIANPSFRVNSVDVKLINPRTIAERAIFIQKNIKKVELDDEISSAIKTLSKNFSNQEYIEPDGKVKLERLFAGALYLQLDRLAQYFDMTNAAKYERRNRYVYGFSKRGFNGYRDLMKNFTTGSEKLIFGNPYLLKQRIPGEGEVTRLLTKANGLLEIDLKISREQALDLQEKIDCAGVSSFYLGKKGLAYVEDIRI